MIWGTLLPIISFIPFPYVWGYRLAVYYSCNLREIELMDMSRDDSRYFPVRRKIEKYNYSDESGTYDIPFVRGEKWYRLSVKKAHEERLQEYFRQQSISTSSIWKGTVIDTYYPSKNHLTFKGKHLHIKPKAMIPGLLYLKTSRMDIGNLTSFHLPLSLGEKNYISYHLCRPHVLTDTFWI